MQVRGPVIAACSFSSWICSFFIIKGYGVYEAEVGAPNLLLAFACTCLFCGIYTVLFLRNTSGVNGGKQMWRHRQQDEEEIAPTIVAL